MSPKIAMDRAALVSRWYQLGLYGNRTLPQAFTEALRLGGELSFHSPTRGGRYTLAEMHDRAHAVAASLVALGIGEGDVVAVQLPNWVEGVLMFHATLIVGAILLPIVPIYGPHEVAFILREARAKAYFVPDQWRKFDYGELVRRLPHLPDLKSVVMLGDPADEGVISWTKFLHDRAPVPQRMKGPDDVCLIVFTSGSTADPKGVRHTHNSLLAVMRRESLNREEESYVSLGLWPAGHIACLLVYLNFYLGNSDITMLEYWDGEVAAKLVNDRRIKTMSGTPFFLINMSEVAAVEGYDLSSLRSFMVGGAAVTPTDVRRCDMLGFDCFRAYGSSEHPIATLSAPNDRLEQRAETDGRPSIGTEVRILDEKGNDLPIGVSGEVALIGPQQFAGYLREDLNDICFLPGGWFLTGDIGRLDANGCLTITDRKKDIIIRGGENISAQEVENVLRCHPSILEAACVAMPDPKYGERVCAFLIMRAGNSLTLEDVRRLFVEHGVAKQKTPERIEIVEELPRTASGKVKKYELRDQLRAEVSVRTTGSSLQT